LILKEIYGDGGFNEATKLYEIPYTKRLPSYGLALLSMYEFLYILNGENEHA
jgi:hypothetical protein